MWGLDMTTYVGRNPCYLLPLRSLYALLSRNMWVQPPNLSFVLRK